MWSSISAQHQTYIGYSGSSTQGSFIESNSPAANMANIQGRELRTLATVLGPETIINKPSRFPSQRNQSIPQLFVILQENSAKWQSNVWGKTVILSSPSLQTITSFPKASQSGPFKYYLLGLAMFSRFSRQQWIGRVNAGLFWTWMMSAHNGCLVAPGVLLTNKNWIIPVRR